MPTEAPVPSHEYDHDVVIVGGGPAGCSAGVFLGRYGLETVIFDRGRSSLQRCAHLENYLGFPDGIGIDTAYDLMHDHAEESGCAIESDLVESVTRTDDGEGFVVDPQEGEAVTAAWVVAATRYDGEYLRPLGGDEMFETIDHDGEEHEHFDREWADEDGTSPVDRLYVVSPSAGADKQAIIAAGRGATVALTLLESARRERGFPDQFASIRDWVRRDANLTGEWADRDRWREYADEHRPESDDIDDEEWERLREAEIDRRYESYITDEEIERRDESGQERLVSLLDDEVVLERARAIEADGEPSEATD